MRSNQLLTAGLLLLGLALASARIPRNNEERQQDEERIRKQKESGIHTYYILVKPPAGAANDKARAESLAADFHKRLGEDKQVSVAAASKDKLVMKIKGDDAFANEMVTAAQSFPETAMLEKKPLYRTLGGRRHGVYRGEDKPEAATM